MSKLSFEYSFCPDCKKWIPAEFMHYFDGIKVCDWCMNQEQEEYPHNTYVHEPYYGKAQCIMCDSYDTSYVEGTKPKKYKCNECGEEFINYES